MTFCERISMTLNCPIGIYDNRGELLEGEDIGFINTQDIAYSGDRTFIRYKDVVIALKCELSQDACNLVKASYEMTRENEAVDFIQPLEYILKSKGPNESARGKYIGYNAFYIKSNINISDIIKDIYDGFSYEMVQDNEGIYFIKKMDDVEQEAEALISGVTLEKGATIIIGSGRVVSGNYTIKDSAEHAKIACSLALNLGFNEGFYHIDKMIIYGLISSTDREQIDFYTNGGYNGFSDLVRDKELIDTAEELFRCHLNISEAARRLYLHRNTLLYRIEKIKNLTGLDIKKFEEAVIFRTVISIYKLNKK